MQSYKVLNEIIMFNLLIFNLLCINLFVVLVHEAGFFTYLDDWVNNKWKFRHLPYIMRCALCQVWWVSLLYIILTGQLTLFGVVLCLVNGHLTKITTPICRLAENIMYKIIELINKWLKL